MSDATEWLTRDEVAERLRIPRGTLNRWAVEKSGPPFAKFGKHVRYRLDLVVAWEERQLTGGAA